MSWLEGSRARLRLLLGRRAAESRMEEEFRFHIEMETDRLVREQQLTTGEARRRALVAFGGVEKHKEALRDGRGLAWLGGLSLDFKLGFRMLVKYPGLTIVGGLAMAFAIWVGTVTFEIVKLFASPTLPLPAGDRIVHLRNWDVEASDVQSRALHDFIVWRDGLRSVTDLGAYRDVTVNLIAADGDARPVNVAEITTSAFRLAPTPPLLGRVLIAADERVDAPPVVVLGHDVWRTRFASDSSVVGRAVQLGDRYATVVGVMPERFSFPIAHSLWTPLRPAAHDRTPGAGPAIRIFGRLAPGVSREDAQAELTTLGRRAAAAYPGTHEQLQPQVVPYTYVYSEPQQGDLRILLSVDLLALMLLTLICGNVALLLFARAATREAELVVRSALGASRGRIVAQLFAEALVLGGVAAAIGLVGAQIGLRRWALPFIEGNMGRVPFWFDGKLSPTTVLYAVGLTVLGAAIAGVVPARKITRGLGGGLRQGSAGGGGPRLGGVWTAVIVTQVAFTVAFPFAAYVEQRELRRIRAYDVGFAPEEYLGVRLEMDAAVAAGAPADSARAVRGARFGAALEAMRRRVAAEPGVSGVTFVDQLPRAYHRQPWIEVDDPSAGGDPAGATSAAAPVSGHEVSLAAIDPSYFDVLRAPILAGRAFDAADVASEARVVIVDQGFVDEVLQGRNPIGRRLRFVDAPGPSASPAAGTRPWYEIVGVVKELGMGYVTHSQRAAGVYQPARFERLDRLHMVVHVRGDPTSLAPQVRAIATAVDPTLRLTKLQTLDAVTNEVLWILGLWLRVTAVMIAIALLLSLAGIYAVLSFTVSRRTREIGVRVALGASRRRIVVAIFRRPLTQVGVGVVAGGVVVAIAGTLLTGGALAPAQVALLVAYAGVMLGICLLACVVPTRRALRVEPTEALRME